MPAGRPRTSADPNARAGRSLGDAELADQAPSFLAPGQWHDETINAYHAFANSTAARALRPEDIWTVRRLFHYLDRLAHTDLSLAELRTLEDVVAKLSTQVGYGPRARLGLGIKTETRPGSRLAAFRERG